jgi:hypothetical protein
MFDYGTPGSKKTAQQSANERWASPGEDIESPDSSTPPVNPRPPLISKPYQNPARRNTTKLNLKTNSIMAAFQRQQNLSQSSAEESQGSHRQTFVRKRPAQPLQSKIAQPKKQKQNIMDTFLAPLRRKAAPTPRPLTIQQFERDDDSF